MAYQQQHFLAVDEEGFLLGTEATEASLPEGRTGSYVASEVLEMGANAKPGYMETAALRDSSSAALR